MNTHYKKSNSVALVLVSLVLVCMPLHESRADEVTGSVSTETVSAPQAAPTVVAPADNSQSTSNSSSTASSSTTSVSAPSTSSSQFYTDPTSGGVSGGMIIHPSTSSLPSGEVLGASTYNFIRELGTGMTGADVTALQSVLLSDGYLVLSAPSGYFGSLTKAAVSKFQAAHGIRQTGYVGPLTLAALNAGTLPTTPEVSSDASSTIANLTAEIASLEAELAALEASSTPK